MNADPKPTVITGPAGTGKTTRMMELVGALAPTALSDLGHQDVLVITHMHGARRRLEGLIHKVHPDLKVTVTTIHAFALGLLNRWRLALDISYPIMATEDAGGLLEKYGVVYATFDELISKAKELSQFSSVKNFISSTYPLIVIDEVQDCSKDELELIDALTSCSHCVLAADEFQDLLGGDAGCAFAGWLALRKHNESVNHEELVLPRRTSDIGILDAARALRTNVAASGRNIAKFWAPKEPLLAWKIVELVLSTSARGRTVALIVPSLQGVDRIVDSVDRQLAKRLKRSGKLKWLRTTSAEYEKDIIYKELGICPIPSSEWKPRPESSLSASGLLIQNRAIRLAKLRGVTNLTMEFVAGVVQGTLHANRAHSTRSGRYEITTIHGAKNREFDYVFVLWNYKVIGTEEKRRRLLYNAITRARVSCTLLVQRAKASEVINDSVLGLLGAITALPQKKASAANKTRKK